MIKRLKVFIGIWLQVNLIVNSTANDPQKLSREELSESVDLRGLEKRLDIRQQEEDVEGIRRLGRLAVKYMGKQNGFQVQNTKQIQQSRNRYVEYSMSNTGRQPVEPDKRSGAVLQCRCRHLHSSGHNTSSWDAR